MIYAAKPQRGGRNIQANTNNPPQDPPPPTETIPLEPNEVFIPIENTAPPVPDVIEESVIMPKVQKKTVKISWIRRFVRKIQNLFRRK